jgi:hypothetical protein
MSCGNGRTDGIVDFQDSRDVRVNLAVFHFVLNDNFAFHSDKPSQIERLPERDAQRVEQLYEIALGVKALNDFYTGIDGSVLVVRREINRGHVLRPELSRL